MAKGWPTVARQTWMAERGMTDNSKKGSISPDAEMRQAIKRQTDAKRKIELLCDEVNSGKVERIEDISAALREFRGAIADVDRLLRIRPI